MKHSNQASRRVNRFGFTLVELLVTIGLISFVASMFLVAYRSAAAEANRIRSTSTIRKISEVLTARMQEYENRPVAFLSPVPTNVVPLFAPGDQNYESPTVLIERAKLAAIRELICTEMPDHPDDIKWTTTWVDNEGSLFNGDGSLRMANRAVGLLPEVGGNPVPVPVMAQTAESGRTRRIRNALSDTSVNPPRPITGWENTNANAELLYLIIEDSTLNGTTAIELFGRSEIGDTDGDGLRELLDANRRPIQWIRWPSGFPGIQRNHPDLLDPSLISNRFSGDSLDRSKADPGFCRTNPASLLPQIGFFPLVVSSGTDGIFGQRFELDPSAIGVLSTANGDYKAHSYSQMPRASLSVCDVEFPAPYRLTMQPNVVYGSRGFAMPDPWFPRPATLSSPLSLQRLGAIINAKAFEDDVTNFDSNGGSL
jgi:prepilin-type N-terminal cleavage/methylation domain-containing protein